MGPYEFYALAAGIPYAVSILFILACHEFGHYFAARYHKVDATLPYFIPFPPIPGFYSKPQTIDDLINHTVGKVLDLFRIEHNLFKRWGNSTIKST